MIYKKLSGEIGNMLKELGLDNRKNIAKWSTAADDSDADISKVEEEEEEGETLAIVATPKKEIPAPTAKSEKNKQLLVSR